MKGTMTLVEAVQDFLAQKRIAVVGVSRTRGHVGNHIFLKLRTAGREVIPVNRLASEVEGVRCYPDLRSIPGGVDAVVVATPPEEAEAVVRQCAELGIRRVWLHRSFGQGSVSDAAVRAGRELNLTVIPAGCPMMFCDPVDPAHRCFRWLLKLTGGLPRQVA